MLDNAAEMCTATTPSPSLSSSACWYVSINPPAPRPTVVTRGRFVDVVGQFVHTVAQVGAVDEDMQRHRADVPLLQLVGDRRHDESVTTITGMTHRPRRAP